MSYGGEREAARLRATLPPLSEPRDPVLDAYLSGDDAAFMRELGLFSIANAYRPRDEDDVDVHPESLRGKILAYYDAWDATPRWLRVLARIMAWRPFR